MATLSIMTEEFGEDVIINIKNAYSKSTHFFGSDDGLFELFAADKQRLINLMAKLQEEENYSFALHPLNDHQSSIFFAQVDLSLAASEGAELDGDIDDMQGLILELINQKLQELYAPRNYSPARSSDIFWFKQETSNLHRIYVIREFALRDTVEIWATMNDHYDAGIVNMQPPAFQFEGFNRWDIEQNRFIAGSRYVPIREAAKMGWSSLYQRIFVPPHSWIYDDEAIGGTSDESDEAEDTEEKETEAVPYEPVDFFEESPTLIIEEASAELVEEEPAELMEEKQAETVEEEPNEQTGISEEDSHNELEPDETAKQIAIDVERANEAECDVDEDTDIKAEDYDENEFIGECIADIKSRYVTCIRQDRLDDIRGRREWPFHDMLYGLIEFSAEFRENEQLSQNRAAEFVPFSLTISYKLGAATFYKNVALFNSGRKRKFDELMISNDIETKKAKN